MAEPESRRAARTSGGIAPPLFRPEALAEREYGEAFAFRVPDWRALAALALAAAALLLLFSMFADFDRVAQVRGVVVASSGVSRLTAPQPGIVTGVAAAQGARVRKGQPIATIAASGFLPNGAAAPAEAVRTYRHQQALAARELDAERRRAGAERLRIAGQIARDAAAGRSFATRIGLQRERIATNAARLKNLAALRAKGYVSDVTYQAQEEAVLTLRQQLAALEQNETDMLAELEQARLRIDALGAEQSRDALRSAGSVAALERGAATAQVQAEVTVRAPFAGTLAALDVTPGMAVAAAAPVATIVPADGGLEILLFVPPRAAGSLRAGQQVSIRYDSFPYQRFGLGRGVVREIATAATDGAGGAAGPSYRIKVRLTGQPAGVPDAALRPDMTLSAGIVLERRSLLDWLLAPLRQKWLENRRERSA